MHPFLATTEHHTSLATKLQGRSEILQEFLELGSYFGSGHHMSWDMGGFAKLVLVFWVLCRCRNLVKAERHFSNNFSAHRVCLGFPLKKALVRQFSGTLKKTESKNSSSKKSWKQLKVATWHRSGSVLFTVPLRNQ